MVASLLVATTLFGQTSTSPSSAPQGSPKACAKPDCKPSKPCPAPCPQPCPPTQMCPQPPNPCCPPWPVPVLNAAYNYPARMTTRCPWDIFVDVSFIYWQPLQENMELGIDATTVSSTLGTGSVLNMDFEYKPGFKVGLGGNLDYDNWDLYGEYTWFHNSQTTTATAANTLYPTRGAPAKISTATYAGGTASQKWKLHMDIADLFLGRSHYVGTKLIFHPNFGMRGAWIRQYLDTTYSNTSRSVVESINNKSQCWAVGPRVGLDTNWMLGYGFRLFGNAEGDILYTNYTRDSFNEYPLDGANPFHVTNSHIHTLRTHLDLEFGFGWGTYWDCNNWHTDVALGYEFQVFFDQNMNRNFVSSVTQAQSNLPNGNLYLQGLTATFRLDF